MLLLQLIFLICINFIVNVANIFAEEQILFNSLDINFDGFRSAEVIETISIVSDKNSFKSGIVRSFDLFSWSLLKTRKGWWQNLSPSLPDQPKFSLVPHSASCDGRSVLYRTVTAGSKTLLLVGDKAKPLQKGPHVFVLKYELIDLATKIEGDSFFEISTGKWRPAPAQTILTLRIPKYIKPEKLKVSPTIYSLEDFTNTSDPQISITRRETTSADESLIYNIQVNRSLKESEILLLSSTIKSN